MQRPIARFIPTVVLPLFALALARNAWMSDDAYITFRTIDNLVSGYGLRWNVIERVQAYTHPLWLFLLTPFYAVTRDAFFTPIILSIVLTLLMLSILVSKISATRAILAVSILYFSRAFIDFSTSGLENPLTNLLLVLFIRYYFRHDRSAFMLGALAALLMLNRIDTGVLVLPAVLASTIEGGRGKNYRALAAGFLPLVVWELFSLVYYGFPFPNTAYAKSFNTGVPERELLVQGIIYLLDSLRYDSLTLLATMVVTMWGFAAHARTRPVSVGVCCYLAYVVYIGGDFMSGRMLVAPLIAAITMLTVADWSEEPGWVTVVAVASIGLTGPYPGPLRHVERTTPVVGSNGIADERLFFFETSSLLHFSRDIPWPSHGFAINGRQSRRQESRVVVFCCNGMWGYFAGPGTYVVDNAGLGDPLLARLPASRPWRSGHFQRDVPAGYIKSIETGQNQIEDPHLAAYYQRLTRITREEVWTRRRLVAIVRMNLGRYNDLLSKADLSTSQKVRF